MIAHHHVLCVAVLLNPPFLIATIRLSPVPCPTAHLPPHETCPHRPLPPEAFPPITFPSTVKKACCFHRSSSNDGIFHVVENGEKSQPRDFYAMYLTIGYSDRRSLGRRWRWEGLNPLGRQVAIQNSTRKS